MDITLAKKRKEYGLLLTGPTLPPQPRKEQQLSGNVVFVLEKMGKRFETKIQLCDLCFNEKLNNHTFHIFASAEVKNRIHLNYRRYIEIHLENFFES